MTTGKPLLQVRGSANAGAVYIGSIIYEGKDYGEVRIPAGVDAVLSIAGGESREHASITLEGPTTIGDAKYPAALDDWPITPDKAAELAGLKKVK